MGSVNNMIWAWFLNLLLWYCPIETDVVYGRKIPGNVIVESRFCIIHATSTYSLLLKTVSRPHWKTANKDNKKMSEHDIFFWDTG